jgi:hypothetical protein
MRLPRRRLSKPSASWRAAEGRPHNITVSTGLSRAQQRQLARKAQEWLRRKGVSSLSD